MGFFARLRAHILGARERPIEPKKAAPPPDPREPMLEAIRGERFGEAQAILRRARGREDEHAVVDALVFALPEEKAAPAELRLALADVLVARGDRGRAYQQLTAVDSAAAKVLRGDLLVEGLEGGIATAAELDRALTLYGEALAADVDAPGVRERFERLRARIGGGTAKNAIAFPTLLTQGGALPFTLVREVARGGAGVVYEAREDLGAAGLRTIALKMIHDHAHGSDALLAEARAAIRFRGQGVVPIYDLDAAEGWLAMAWMPGGSLRARLATPPPLEPLFESLLSTLADVHRAGWVHGDIKPANVLFDHEGRAVLTDFGLARPTGSASTAGTPGYVSRERLAGRPASPHDDIHGLGCMARDLREAGADDPLLLRLEELGLSDAAPNDAAAMLVALRSSRTMPSR